MADSLGCHGRHRDLQLWNRQQVECCLSCGSLIIALSDLHKPLQFSDEIRLLQLLPASNDRDDLVGELIHGRLGDMLVYEAVSYTWADKRGVTKHSGNLFIKSRQGVLKITSNCDAMLRKFRDKQSTRLLWVDSICIDQENTLERSEQVQAMTAIYREAQRVLVFIGNPPWNLKDDYDTLFRFIRSLKSKERRLKLAEMGVMWRGAVEIILLVEGLAHLRQTLLRLFRYPWFHRIWVVQEVIMGQSVVLHFGPHVLDWEDISMRPSSDLLRTDREFDPVISPRLPPVLRLGRGIRHDGANLTYLLSATRACAASDPRDKIFAVLGMAKAEVGLELPRADYSKSVAQVFTEAALYCIRSTNTLNIFSTPRSPLRTMPSWVPDFTNINTLSPLPEQRDYLLERHRNILQNEQKLRKPIIFGIHSSKAVFLNAEGIFLDTITFVQDDQKEIVRAVSGEQRREGADIVLAFQHLFRLPSNRQFPSTLVHCPPRRTRFNLFTTLSPGVEAWDLEAVDLLAPYYENLDTPDEHPPNCSSTLDHFYSSVVKFGGGRAVSCGVDTLGIVPIDTRAGDQIWMLSTASNPLVLRLLEDRLFTIIGPCTIITPHTPSSCSARDGHRTSGCDCRSCSIRNEDERTTQWRYAGISIV